MEVQEYKFEYLLFCGVGCCYNENRWKVDQSKVIQRKFDFEKQEKSKKKIIFFFKSTQINKY